MPVIRVIDLLEVARAVLLEDAFELVLYEDKISSTLMRVFAARRVWCGKQ
jgi:hypothetical protein